MAQGMAILDQSLLDEVFIEPMRPADLEAVMAIEHASYTTPWTANGVLTEIERQITTSLVARRGAQLAGYVFFWIIAGEAHLLNLAVAPELRGRGVGGILLGYMIELCRERRAREAYLEVRVGNAAARALYEKYGFVMTGRRKNYYQEDHEDALTMARSI